MNTLSWMLYLAELFGSLGVFFSVITVGGIVILGAVTVAYAIETDKLLPHIGKIATGLALSAFLAAAMPSTKTVYLIIGSQIGEKVAMTPEAQEIYQLLKDRVKEALTKK